jgi:hypothetical protein
MFSSKNAYPAKHRSEISYFHGGYTVAADDTEKSLDLPKSVYLTNGNSYEKKFSIRVDLHSKYIEIPLSMTQLKEWFAKIEQENSIELEQELAEERAEIEAEKAAAIDMGEYDIGQEKGELNWMTDAEWASQYDDAYLYSDDEEIQKCTLTPSTYDHAGDCVPSKEKCEFCYKYWCGKCGNGLSNYLVKCCY